MKSVSLESPLAPTSPLRSAFRPTRTPSSPRAGRLFTGPPLNAQNIPVSITGPKGQLLSIHCERFNNPVRRCALRLVKRWEQPFCFKCGNPSHTQTHKRVCMKGWMSFSFPGTTLNRFVFVLSLRGPLDSIFMDVHFSSTTKSRFWWGGTAGELQSKNHSWLTVGDWPSQHPFYIYSVLWLNRLGYPVWDEFESTM